jgi:hypothetical protein
MWSGVAVCQRDIRLSVTRAWALCQQALRRANINEKERERRACGENGDELEKRECLLEEKIVIVSPIVVASR